METERAATPTHTTQHCPDSGNLKCLPTTHFDPNETNQTG